MGPTEIEDILKTLPEELRDEVVDYIEFLRYRYKRVHSSRKSKVFNFSWERGLEEMKEEYSSVDLQHEASEWR